MSHYAENPAMCRVDYFKRREHGLNWSHTEAVRFGPYDGTSIHDAFVGSVRSARGGRLPSGLVAVCLEPYHLHSHPIAVTFR